MYILTHSQIIKRDYSDYLPQKLRSKILTAPDEGLCEIRIYKNRPVILRYTKDRFFLSGSGFLTKQYNEAYITDSAEFVRLCELIVDFSAYAHEEELKNAYVTVKGGHRIGFAGEIKNGMLRSMNDITSINFRLAHEHIGIADCILKDVLYENRVKNTIIISPPMCGKTSLLRDLIRLLSKQLIKVGVCDTRGEIAAVYDGVPYMDIGDADVITGTSKAVGMMMLLRCMSPEVIACDELGGADDYKAVETIMHSGVSVIATAHAKTSEGLFKAFARNGFCGSFDVVIRLSGTGEIKEVYNA